MIPDFYGIRAPFYTKGSDFVSFLDHYFEFAHQFDMDVREILLSEAAEEVKDIMQEQLDDVVYSYDASPQAMESRRYENGGLADRANMVAHLEPGLTLVVENIAPFQEAALNREAEDDLSDVVEKGIRGYNQPGPRPFVASTEAECVTSGRVLKSINNGLTARGYKIEKEA